MQTFSINALVKSRRKADFQNYCLYFITSRIMPLQFCHSVCPQFVAYHWYIHCFFQKLFFHISADAAGLFPKRRRPSHAGVSTFTESLDVAWRSVRTAECRIIDESWVNEANCGHQPSTRQSIDIISDRLPETDRARHAGRTQIDSSLLHAADATQTTQRRHRFYRCVLAGVSLASVCCVLGCIFFASASYVALERDTLKWTSRCCLSRRRPLILARVESRGYV